MKEEDVRIEYMALDELVRAPRNPKDHDIGTISNSIERFGYIAPCLVNEATGKLVAGHGRLDTLQRMKAMGKGAPERVRVDERGRWLIPVIRGVSFANEVEAEAYLLADNRLVEVGGWEDEELAQVLSDIAAQGEEALRGIGWDADDVDALLKRMGMNIGGEEDEEEKSEDDIIDEQWAIIVECESEEDQLSMLDMLIGMGKKAKALVS